MNDKCIFTVSGKDATEFLNRICTQDIKAIKDGEGAYSCICSNKGKILADLECRREGDAFKIICDRSLKEKIIKIFKQYIIMDDVQIEDANETLPEFSDSDTAAQEVLRIESCRPKYGVDMSEENIPQEANLYHALSFDKGCYIGQETIARLENLGHVNKELCLLKLSGNDIPKPKDLISNLEGTEIGWITSACQSPKYNAPIAMGYIKYKHRDLNEVMVGGQKAQRLRTK